MFKVNEGWFDRFARGSAGVVLIVIALMAGAPIGWTILFGVVGVVLFVTGVVGFCPLYTALHVDTRPHKA